MTEQDVIRRVHDADPQLAGEVAGECREPARTVLDSWRNGAACGEACCAFVCRHLEELAMAEALEAAGSASPEMRVQLLELVVERQLILREYLLTVLKPLLDASVAAKPMRACDAAYLLARRLVALEPEEAARFSAEAQFASLDEEKRDAEIGEWKTSKAWLAVFPNG